MIGVAEVQEHLKQQPFEPFRICMTDGRTYDIHHPDLCMVGRTTVYVGVPDPKAEGVVMRVDHCAMVHIVRFEPLNGRRQRPKNGRRT